jgi:hypothetical protein
MAGLVPAIHVLLPLSSKKDVDARNKCGHDGFVMCAGVILVIPAERSESRNPESSSKREDAALRHRF